jgi:hypothetical protein
MSGKSSCAGRAGPAAGQRMPAFSIFFARSPSWNAIARQAVAAVSTSDDRAGSTIGPKGTLRATQEIAMRAASRITTIIAALCLSGWPTTGSASPPNDIKADARAAAQLSLTEARDILKPWVLWCTVAGDVVFKGGTVNGGAFTVAMDHETTAQRRENAPGVWYQLHLGNDSNAWTGLMSLDRAQQLLNALKRWQMSSAAERQGWEAQKAKEFAAIAVDYRAANPKPVISEDVRRYEIMADADIRAKRNDDATNAYEAGLKLAPWWPEGHFNIALVLGKMGSYGEAIRHMKNYLALVPDAPDARAAQDKIYVWQSGNDD